MEVTGQEARFRAMFAEEAEGRLTTLSELLLELERDAGNQELLSSIFREAHTLKGGAAVVGLNEVMRVAHAMEEVLEGLRDGTATATQGLVDGLLGAVNGIRELLPAVRAEEDRAAEAGALVVALQAPAPDPQPTTTPPPDPPPAATAPPPAATPAPVRRGRRKTIRLPTERLDELVRLAGEASAAALRVGRLVTDQLGADPAGVPELHELTRALESLQERTLQARMVPFGTIAEPLRRAARDLARSLGKSVELELRGQETELDRGVLEQVADPLLHLVRNAIDHGIEPPEARLGAGKPASGTVRVHAMQLGSEVVVTVADDGRGIDLERVRERAGASGDSLDGVGDAEALYAIFRSGLSTAAAVSEVSGRGVGLDVVRTSLAAVRGRVEVHSEPGAGSEFRLNVPITLAVLPCLLVETAGRRLAIPMHSVVSAEAAGADEDWVEGQAVIRVRDQILPVSDLAVTLEGPGPAEAPAGDRPGRGGGQHDPPARLPGRRPARPAQPGRQGPGAAAPPPQPARRGRPGARRVGAARARRLRPGRPGPLDALGGPARPATRGPAAPPRPPGPGRSAQRPGRGRHGRGPGAGAVDPGGGRLPGPDRRRRPRGPGRPRPRAGRPGRHRRRHARPRRPGADPAIRSDRALAGLPVVVVTSKAAEADRRRAMDAGADAYLVKGDLDQRALLEVVGRLLGLAVQLAGEVGR